MAHAQRSETAGAAVGTQTGVLLFYKIDTGLATTGRIDAGGNYTDLMNHNFDRGWRVFPLGDGSVLFNKTIPPDSSLLVGRVQADGSYQDLREFPRFGNPATLVPVGDNIVLDYRSADNAIVFWRVENDGGLVRLKSHRFDGGASVVSTHDGLALFYRADRRTAATIRVSSDGNFQNLKNHTGFDAWTHIISTTNRILLFYNEFTGAAATGRLDADGNYADLGTFEFDRNWRYVVPTMDGHVLFFSGLRGARALLGRIDGNGRYMDGPVVTGGFDPWTYIVPVI